MGIYMNPGSKSFCESLESQIYIDKTLLIAQINAVVNTKQKFVCVSRPRRFGKSMAADMLSAYYGRGEDTSALFDNLKIAADESYREHLNKYDVIKINMQEFLSATHDVDEMLAMLKKYVMFDLFEQYDNIRFRDENNFVQVIKDIYTIKYRRTQRRCR